MSALNLPIIFKSSIVLSSMCEHEHGCPQFYSLYLVIYESCWAYSLLFLCERKDHHVLGLWVPSNLLLAFPFPFAFPFFFFLYHTQHTCNAKSQNILVWALHMVLSSLSGTAIIWLTMIAKHEFFFPLYIYDTLIYPYAMPSQHFGLRLKQGLSFAHCILWYVNSDCQTWDNN